MDFLKYIEHSAENLQFYMWVKGYIERFEDLPANERALSPEWTQAQEEAEVSNFRNAMKEKPLAVEANTILRNQNLASASVNTQSESKNPFGDSQAELGEKTSIDSAGRSQTGVPGTMGTIRTNWSSDASAAFEDAGCKFQPCE